MAEPDQPAHISETELALRRHQTVERLLRALVHELNNHLYAIQGFSELSLPAVPEGSSTSANLQRVLEGCSRAREVVEQLNSLTHAATPGTGPLDLQRAVPELVRLLRRSRPPGVELRVTIDPDAGHILGSVADLHVMLTALVESAEAELAGAPGTIELSVRRPPAAGVEGAGGVVRFSISHHRNTPDDPAALPPPRGSAGADRRLGALALARAAAMRLGAQSAAARSAPETSAVVLIDLPVRHAVEPGAHPAEPKTAPSGGRVLFVDDERVLVDLGRDMLTWLGYDPEVTTDPRHALERFRAEPHRYVCVITDHTMPIMSGEDLVAELRKVDPRASIIVCSGHSEPLTPERAKELGVAAYMSKPFTIDDLGRAIRRAARPDARSEEG